MKKTIINFMIIILIVMGHTATMAQKHEKKAQTGCQFLSVISDARAAAMAGAVTSLELGSSSLFFNPAGIANMDNYFDITASNNNWIADIKHNAFSLAINPWRGQYGVIGFTVQSVDYGDKFYGTIEDFSGASDYINIEGLSPTALAIGVGYAKALSDRFSVGGQVRWVKQDFGEFVVPLTADTTGATEKAQYDMTPMSFDFGTIFKTGVKSLTFGMSVRNFSREIKYIEEGFQLPLVFTLGIHMDLMDLIDLGGPAQSAILSLNATHDRSHAEQFIAAIDYKILNAISLRLGYVSGNDEDNINYGLGISLVGLTVDYAYTPFGIFNNVQRLTFRFAL